MNEVARRVLQSLDAVVAAEKDHGKCLQHIICENNKFSRDREDNQKLWMPVWRYISFVILYEYIFFLILNVLFDFNFFKNHSLGLSWLSSRVIKTQLPSKSILENLKASALGLGRADCKLMFPCNIDFRNDRWKK